MSNEKSGRGTDYLGAAVLVGLILLWQLLEIIKAILIVGAIAVLGWGSYWIWSKIQAQKNQQRYLDNFYGNMNHNQYGNQHNNPQNQISNHQSNQLPPSQSYNNPSTDPNFKDFQEYQKFRDWQRFNQKANTTNNQQNYNPYSDNYEG